MTLLDGVNSIKYVLFAYNLAFLITGVVLIGVGVGVKSAYVGYEPFLDSKFFSIPTLLIVTGSLIIIITFFGCWSALRENYHLMLIFTAMMVVIFILELISGISGYVLNGDAHNLINAHLKDSMRDYGGNNTVSVTKLWDRVQRDMNCCGVASYTDWKPYFNESLPLSCCNIPSGTVGTFSCISKLENINLKAAGCLQTFADDMASHAVTLGAVGVLISIIQLIGLVFAAFVTREIKIKNGISGWF